MESGKLVIAQQNVAKRPELWNNVLNNVNDSFSIYAISEPPRNLTTNNMGYEVIMAPNGHTAIILLDSIYYKLLTVSNYVTGILVKTNGLKLKIYSIYIPPYYASPVYRFSRQSAIDMIESILKQSHRKSIILGDFNMKFPGFGDDKTKDTRSFFTTLSSHEWTILNRSGIHTFSRGDRRSTLDYTLVSKSLSTICDWHLGADLSGSDHEIIFTSLTASLSGSPTRTKKATFINTKSFLNKLSGLTVDGDVDTMFDNLDRITAESTKLVISREKRSIWNKDIANSKRTIKRLLKKLNRTPVECKDALRLKIKECTTLHKSLLKKSRENYYKSLCNNRGEVNALWKLWRDRKLRNRSIVNCLLVEDQLITDLDEVSRIALDHFHPSGSTDINLALPPVDDDQPVTASATDLASAILKLKKNSAPGPDNIPVYIINQWYKTNPQLLLSVVNKCLSMRKLPPQLLTSRLTLIKKDPSLPSTLCNVRPIGVPNSLTKLIELIIILLSSQFLHLSDLQYAYQEGKSAEQALMDIQCVRAANQAHHRNEVLIALDVKGAFTNVQIEAIISTVRHLPSSLLEMLTHYLLNRQTFLSINPTVKRKITRGVTQGSCLGPLLFTLTLDTVLVDFVKLATDKNITLNLFAYADDITVLFSGWNSPRERSKGICWIISTLNSLLSSIGLQLSTPKTRLMCNSSLSIPHLVVANTNFTFSQECKVLGLTFSSNNKFDKHLQHVKNNCLSVLDDYTNLFREERGIYFSSKAKSTVVKAAVFSSFSYAAHVWLSHLGPKRLAEATQNVDNHIAHTVYGTMLTLPSLAAKVIVSGLNLFHYTQYMAELKSARWRHWSPRLQMTTLPCITGITKQPMLTRGSDIHLQDDVLSLDSDIIYYTDASVDQSENNGISRCGAAFVMQDRLSGSQKAFSFSLPSYLSVFEAECQGVLQAVTHLIQRCPGRSCSVITDSKSLVHALFNPSSSHPYVAAIKEKANQAVLLNSRITIYWCKAHNGVIGNEKADKLARAAVARPSFTINPPVSYISLKRLESRHWLNQHIEQYDNSSSSTLFKQFFPTVAHVEKNRHLFNYYSLRIFSGHGPFGHYYWKLSRSNLSSHFACECGAENQNVEHILLHCPILTKIQLHLREKSGLNTLIRDGAHWNDLVSSPILRKYICSAAKEIVLKCIAMSRNFKLPKSKRTRPQQPKCKKKVRGDPDAQPSSSATEIDDTQYSSLSEDE